MRTASVTGSPRAQTICFPSGESANAQTCSDDTFMIRFAGAAGVPGEPTGCAHRLDAPSFSTIKRTARPSFVHTMVLPPSPPNLASGATSKALRISPPSIPTMASFAGFDKSGRYSAAMDFPSGETTGKYSTSLLTLTGTPPSIPIFFTAGDPPDTSAYTTNFPSGEQSGHTSSGPFVSCFQFVPSRSERQRDRLKPL